MREEKESAHRLASYSDPVWRLDQAVTHRRCPSLVTTLSGDLGQDLVHLRGRESVHRLRTDVTQHVRCQQHTGSGLIIRGLENAHLVVLTERPIHLLNGDSHRLHLGGPGGYPLGRLLGALDAFIGELHQTDVRRLTLLGPRGNL